jgi:hypothetical protein
MQVVSYPAASDSDLRQHMIMGMQTVWVFGDTSDILKLPKPRVEGYLTYGGGKCFCLLENTRLIR